MATIIVVLIGMGPMCSLQADKLTTTSFLTYDLTSQKLEHYMSILVIVRIVLEKYIFFVREPSLEQQCLTTIRRSGKSRHAGSEE